MSNSNLYPSTMEMIRYSIDTSTHREFVPNTTNIRRVLNPNYMDLRREMMCFNIEMEWDEMWTFQDAQDRLRNGWYFFCFFVNHQIKGWVWFDDKTRTLRNLYVNKDYRSKGYATQLVKRLVRECYENGIKSIKCEVDDWNESSHSVFNKCNWIKVD